MDMMTMHFDGNLLVIIPTYNEIDNIVKLLPEVFKNVPEDAGILVVDDGSPDGTAGAVKGMIEIYGDRLHLLERSEKKGLADAYITGFHWGLENGYDVLCEMDADFSHKPEYLVDLYNAIQTHDVAIGSRNISGGAVEGWSAMRNLISKGGSLYSRMVLRCPIRDLTGGYNMWRKTALESIRLDTIISKGYSFQIEMKYKAYKAGCSIQEIPIVFPDRTAGESKMSKGIFMEALKAVWKIRNC
ncbi:MAG: polyprenol monophosphomannose synthase [Treponemataceae bacterium]|nr:polyprenol monophosphomannose synthase [Treponemataceae bacterium]